MISIVRSRPNSVRRCKSCVLEFALVIRALVGHRMCCTTILAIRLCSWTDIMLFYLFNRTVKECPPPVIKEMSLQKMMPTTLTLLFAMTVRVVTKKCQRLANAKRKTFLLNVKTFTEKILREPDMWIRDDLGFLRNFVDNIKSDPVHFPPSVASHQYAPEAHILIDGHNPFQKTLFRVCTIALFFCSMIVTRSIFRLLLLRTCNKNTLDPMVPKIWRFFCVITSLLKRWSSIPN